MSVYFCREEIQMANKLMKKDAHLISYQENTNQKYNEIPLYTQKDDKNLKDSKKC